jgi:ABC-type dipeptide/oligopeptide/nickel transport system permease subunit
MDIEERNDLNDEAALFKKTLWLNAKAFGLGLGLLFGFAIFIATNWLVLKGGDTVGPHLQLLSQYFIGYRVTFAGSLIGFAYGFVTGWISGVSMGWIYNKIAMARHLKG